MVLYVIYAHTHTHFRNALVFVTKKVQIKNVCLIFSATKINKTKNPSFFL